MERSVNSDADEAAYSFRPLLLKRFGKKGQKKEWAKTLHKRGLNFSVVLVGRLVAGGGGFCLALTLFSPHRPALRCAGGGRSLR